MDKSVQISTDDKKALQYILVNESYRFPKPAILRNLLAISLDQGISVIRIVRDGIIVNIKGPGIVVAEGDIHKRQRKIMVSPTYSRNLLSLTNGTLESFLRSSANEDDVSDIP